MDEIMDETTIKQNMEKIGGMVCIQKQQNKTKKAIASAGSRPATTFKAALAQADVHVLFPHGNSSTSHGTQGAGQGDHWFYRTPRCSNGSKIKAT